MVLTTRFQQTKMNESNLIVLDCDDVISELRFELTKLLQQHTDQIVDHRDWIEHGSVPEQYNLGTFKDFESSMVEHDIIENANPDPNASYVIDTIRNKGYYVYILTARGWHPRGTEATEQWCAEHNLHVDDIVCVDISHCKSETLERLGPIKAFVDDNHRHVLNSMHLPIQYPIIMNRPWNVQASNHPYRIDELPELLDFVEDK